MAGRLKHCDKCRAPFHPKYTPAPNQHGERLCYSCREVVYGIPAPPRATPAIYPRLKKDSQARRG